MATYNKEQTDRYLAYVGFSTAQLGASDGPKPDSLEHLTQLVFRQLATVPMESLSLHYSQTHQISIDPADLYEKMVGTGRGGYCMENNTFFGTMLRSLGYEVLHVGARVSDATAGRDGGGFMGLNHMANLVTISGQRYLVDVGFGGDSPCRPLPLVSGHEAAGIGRQRLRLDLKTLPQHTDRAQKVWVYSHRAGDDGSRPEDPSSPSSGKWTEGYAFTETEFFAADFEVMNLATSTVPTGFFVQAVLCVKVRLDAEKGEPEGHVILLNGRLSRRIRGQTEVLEELESEDQRVAALQRWFGIALSEDQRRGIVSLPSELKGPH